MLAKITLYDGTIYKIADKTTDTQDGLYLGRIKDELSLVSAMQEAGNAPATINLTIINDDDFIPHSKDLWAADVLLTNDNGVSWRGKINFCNFDADGNLYVTASEKTAPELELQLPDEVRQVYTVDEDFHQSSVTMTIPLVIGGTHEKPILVPTILIDKTQGIYLICVGEIREIVAVYNGTERLSLADYGSYRGTAEQVYHKGFAYVALNSGKRLNADGSYAEINVEVVGLKLGDFTEEECRNGALFLYYFLTTAATGINGWGCGIDPSEIDTASFQSAITLCNQLGYKLDGIMWLRQSAQSWIDQICQAIHGKYSINANGKRSLFIDYAGNASKKTFTASNMQVDKYGKNSYTSVVYNKGILSYDYNPITGLFMQSAQYENAESIAQIGEQKFVGESYLLKDPTTALAVLEYTCKRSQTAAEAIEFKTDDIDTVLRAGDVITINRPDLSINNALYQIQNISTTDYEASISAVKFDTSVFIVSGTPSSVNWGSEKAITPALTPAQATNLLLSTGFDINPDGTGTPYISGTFTVPAGGWLAAAVQYGIGTNPQNWTELALITDGNFKISPVNVDTVYSIRVRMITSTGHSDYITGQITATGDTTPPAEPTIAANATDKTVTVQCGLDNPPYDMGGFQIYRKKSTEADSAYTLIAMVAANRGYASYSDYVSEYITYNYKAKSYDRSGNLSTNFSNVASVTVTGIQANDVAATALAMPTGSILRLSAKNCTTASIAEANGVKDVSGNGNHGRAYGGVEVVQDTERGEVFSFDGSNDYLLQDKTIALTREMTFSVWCKSQAGDTYRFIIDLRNSGNRDGLLLAEETNRRIRVISRDTNNNRWDLYSSPNAFVVGEWYHVVAVFDTQKTFIYVNGVKIVEGDYYNNSTNSYKPLIAKAVTDSNHNYKGELTDIRIYPRALTASEIKTLYMFPDDVTFGQLTADLIGANVIKAQNLIMTENVISNAAQINQAVFQSLIVTNGSTVANQVNVGGRNLLKNSNNGGNGWSNTNYDVCSINLGNNKPKANDTVTVSLEGSIDWTKIAYISFWNSGGSVMLGSATSSDFDSNNVCNKTFSWKINSASNTFFRIYAALISGVSTRPTTTINWVKLEYGNKATTWTPAPEDVDADSTAKANAVKNGLGTNGYTSIHGGNIMTDTVTANAIAANAITAEKLSVTAGIPSKCIFRINVTGLTATSAPVGTVVPNLGLSKLVFKVAGAAANLNSWTNALSGGGGTGQHFLVPSRGAILSTGTNVTIGTAFTFCADVDQGQAVYDRTPCVFDMNAGNANNRVHIGFKPDLSIRLVIFDSDGTSHEITSTIKASVNTSTRFGVSVNGDNIIFVINGKSETKTLANSRVSATMNIFSIGDFFDTPANRQAAHIAFPTLWNQALTANQMIMLMEHGVLWQNDAGEIRADRIATDAIRGRNASGGGDGSFTTNGLIMSLAGNGWLSAKNFYLKSDGSASFKGAVTATSGKVGDFVIGTNSLNCNYENSGVTQSLNLQLNSLGVFYNSSTNYIYSYISQAGLQCYNQSVGNIFKVNTRQDGSAYNKAFVTITPSATTKYGLYVAGKARINATDYTSDEATKKDFQNVSTLDKLKKLRVCAWRFDEEKLVEKENAWIDSENIKIEAENKAIDAEIEKENEKRKNRKDGEPVELLPLKEHKKLIKHRIADKTANHPLNIGCMAGEFNKAFGTNDGSEDCLSVTDTIGVCMRAIQELAAEVDELKAKLKIQQDSKSDVELETSYTEKSDSSKDADNLEFADVGKMFENKQEEQK